MSFEYSHTYLSTPELNNIYKELQQSLKKFNVPASKHERKKEIMDLLHEFNDVKDAAQIVLGTLALMDGKTAKELHLQYNLPLKE